MLLDYVLELPVDSKSVLELGAGSGFISLYLAKNRDCHVLASDINPNAINGLEESALLNQVNLQLVQCDLFDKIPRIQFDYILINPPYFDKTISSIDEYAFYAGEDLDYFSRLFDQIKQYISPKTKVIVILSETAPLKNLFNMAQSAGLFFQQVHQQKKRNETFFIFELDFIHREQHDDHSIAS
jgi:release factor glutamine methyltransferase